MQTIEIRNNQRRPKTKCPICKVNSLFQVKELIFSGGSPHACALICGACEGTSIWKKVKIKDNYTFDLQLISPIQSAAPTASTDMPADVKSDYNEAGLVLAHSPRASAALLRLALQKLCVHLGEPGENLNTDIRSLAKRPEFSDRIIKAADTVRITGNNAVHPGEMNDEDIDNISIGLFELINLIVDAGITKPKRFDAFYGAVPEKPRKEAEKKDGRDQ